MYKPLPTGSAKNCEKKQYWIGDPYLNLDIPEEARVMVRPHLG